MFLKYYLKNVKLMETNFFAHFQITPPPLEI